MSSIGRAYAAARWINFVKLGLNLGYAPPGTNPADLVPLVQEAERLGFDSAT